MTAARIFRGGVEVDAVDAGDRGLAYGDGLFETMRVHRGQVPWLVRHWQRLLRGAERLELEVPAMPDAARVIAELFADGGDGVARLLVSRGIGDRGYAPPVDPVPTWVVSRHPLPAPPRRGLLLHACRLRLGHNPLLAGIKHCNRLEQVMARHEAQLAGADEGLLQDVDGRVVSATAANLLLLRQGQWLTPSLKHCGVAGTVRDWLLEQGMVREAELDPDAVAAADALALCNAVRGILPVAALGERHWAPHPAVDALRGRLARAHPGFAGEDVA